MKMKPPAGLNDVECAYLVSVTSVWVNTLGLTLEPPDSFIRFLMEVLGPVMKADTPSAAVLANFIAWYRANKLADEKEGNG